MNLENSLDHLAILRKHLLYAVAGYFVIAVCFAILAKPLFFSFAQPLIDLLPYGSSLIATDVASPFFIPLKFSLLFSLGVALPWFLYQMWRFVSPGLFQQEKRLLFFGLILSIGLFYAGIAFSYFFVMPLALSFFVGSAPIGVTVMTDISAYMDFAIKLLLAFGLAFETPLAVVLLVRTGIVRVEQLQNKRGYVIIAAFTLGMLLTPPDVFSQTLLAIPLWLLFEAGLWLSAKVK